MENLVFDVGTDGFVAGWAGTDSPRIVLPPVSGIIHQTPPSNPKYLIGKESLQSFQPGPFQFNNSLLIKLLNFLIGKRTGNSGSPS